MTLSDIEPISKLKMQASYHTWSLFDVTYVLSFSLLFAHKTHLLGYVMSSDPHTGFKSIVHNPRNSRSEHS